MFIYRLKYIISATISEIAQRLNFTSYLNLQSTQERVHRGRYIINLIRHASILLPYIASTFTLGAYTRSETTRRVQLRTCRETKQTLTEV